jgi:hypothetical protein
VAAQRNGFHAVEQRRALVTAEDIGREWRGVAIGFVNPHARAEV